MENIDEAPTTSLSSAFYRFECFQTKNNFEDFVNWILTNFWNFILPFIHSNPFTSNAEWLACNLKNISSGTNRHFRIKHFTLSRTSTSKLPILRCKNLSIPLVEEESEMNFIVQNMHVILNPGFCASDDHRAPLSPTKTNFYGFVANDDFDQDSVKVPFSRKMSVFFTGNTIKRIWVRVYPEDERLIIK